VQALTVVKSILIRGGFKSLIEELDLDKIINKVEGKSRKDEANTH
jgi:hypothetical protein